MESEQTISRMQGIYKGDFVNKGMAADWAYHEKEGNHHVLVCVQEGI